MSAPIAFFIITAITVAALVWLSYRRDMRAARERLSGHTRIVPSPYGDIEYAEGGTGMNVLIVHAAAGGWDQGALIAEAVLDDRFRWIAPSRFGYLRSGFRSGTTCEQQAHAYACLLDHLGIDRVAVVAMSAGGPSALLFAILYPHRVSSLTLISCGVDRATGEEQARANRKGNALVRILNHDFGLWLMTRLFRKRLLELMGVNDATALPLDFRQLHWIERVMDAMHPASIRKDGVGFDNTASLPGYRIAAVQAPTLIIHAQDDSLQLYHNALFAESHIPHAVLAPFQSGGHLVVITQRAEIRGLVQRHIFEHSDKSNEITAPPTAA